MRKIDAVSSLPSGGDQMMSSSGIHWMMPPGIIRE